MEKKCYNKTKYSTSNFILERKLFNLVEGIANSRSVYEYYFGFMNCYILEEFNYNTPEGKT